MLGREKGASQQDLAKEGKENKEIIPSEIHIFAIEHTETTKDTVTKQGFGYSSPLESPQTKTFYHWEGKLNPTEFERTYPQGKEGYVGSSMADEDIEGLAENFAARYRETQNPELQKRGESSYSLKFEPSENVARKTEAAHGKEARVRGLTQDEHRKFMDAFSRANQEATKNK